jgi:adenylate cyclase
LRRDVDPVAHEVAVALLHHIAARLEGVAQPGAICLSELAYWQVKGRLDLKVSHLGNTQLKNIVEPIQTSPNPMKTKASVGVGRKGLFAEILRSP